MDENNRLIRIETDNFLTKSTSLFESKTIVKTHYNKLLQLMTNEGDILVTRADQSLSAGLQLSDKDTVHHKVSVLLGKYAEAIMVMQCNNHPSINRYFARIARLGRLSSNDYLNNFVAIGTGLYSTDNNPNYSHHHQPNERQRDIVWVDKRELLSLLTIPKKPGAIAGIQIKVSYNWRNVLKKDITRYRFPILYFDMNNDWDRLDGYIKQKKKDSEITGDTKFNNINLVPKNEYTDAMEDILKWFEKKLIAIVEGKLTIEKLIEMARIEEDAALGHALTEMPKTEEQALILARSIKEAEKQRELEIEREKRVRNHIDDLARGLYGIKYK